MSSWPNAHASLSDLVLGPIAGKARRTEWRGRRLAIVASGALEYVPFAALPLPARRLAQRQASPLVAAHEIVTLPSASSLALLRRREPRPPGREGDRGLRRSGVSPPTIRA